MEHEAASLCVTGATGFIGAALCRRIIELGLPVIAVGHARRPDIEGACALTWDEFIDIAKRPALTTIHLAGPNSIEQLERLGSQAISQQCQMAKLVTEKSTRVIFASSASVYPKNIQRPLLESDEVIADSVYARLKLQVEQIVIDNGGAVVRLSNCFGPRCSTNTILMSLVRGLNSDLGFVRVRSAADERDYLFIEDAVDGFVRLANDHEAGGVFNFGTGISTSVEQLFKALCKVTGITKQLISESSFLGNRIVLCSERAERELKWRASTTLIDGLRKTLQPVDNEKRGL